MNKFKIISLTLVVFLSSFILSGCRKKTPPAQTETRTIPKELTIADNEKPIIALIPRADGHELKLKVTNIPTVITQVEYELIYSAKDNGLEMEKGVGDTVKLTSNSFEKDLLLGTESCTNGCKYKFDEGVVGGVLSLTFYTEDNQTAVFETPFTLATSTDIKKSGSLSLDLENFSINATTTTKNDFFILIKNYRPYYSVFSNGNGAAKITKISPETVIKENINSLVGDYLIN
ncbi:MAG TPA: hypothetical protein PKZ92_00180 [Candidatus Woesebacteria bacterium]|jgi:hypothetical protein|nr:hypothetical protein [Candidatus Shapirobacteria bacterium]HOR01673.1 hypothetical protein [Candidatus Woesebacteria bacterium]